MCPARRQRRHAASGSARRHIVGTYGRPITKARRNTKDPEDHKGHASSRSLEGNTKSTKNILYRENLRVLRSLRTFVKSRHVVYLAHSSPGSMIFRALAFGYAAFDRSGSPV